MIIFNKNNCVEEITDIMVGAIEGGISYWGYMKGYRLDNEVEEIRHGKPEGEPISTWSAYLLLKGATLFIQDQESSSIWDLTLDKLTKGIQLNHENRTMSNPNDYDANDCDAIIQYSVFGEIVFG